MCIIFINIFYQFEFVKTPKALSKQPLHSYLSVEVKPHTHVLFHIRSKFTCLKKIIPRRNQYADVDLEGALCTLRLPQLLWTLW